MTIVKDWQKEVVNIDLTNEELNAAINLLDFTAAIFVELAEDARINDDSANFDNLQVRIAFAKIFAKKLQSSLELGNTKNKTFH